MADLIITLIVWTPVLLFMAVVGAATGWLGACFSAAVGIPPVLGGAVAAVGSLWWLVSVAS